MFSSLKGKSYKIPSAKQRDSPINEFNTNGKQDRIERDNRKSETRVTDKRGERHDNGKTTQTRRNKRKTKTQVISNIKWKARQSGKGHNRERETRVTDKRRKTQTGGRNKRERKTTEKTKTRLVCSRVI